jgi:ketosteroid isomerase-like protein
MVLADAHPLALSILTELQAAVDSRDVDRLSDLFGPDAVLVGTASDARDSRAIRAYLSALAAAPTSIGWEWDDVVVSYESPEVLAFSGYGSVASISEQTEIRAPIRLTVLAARSSRGWHLLQFHGSIPSDLAQDLSG